MKTLFGNIGKTSKKGLDARDEGSRVCSPSVGIWQPAVKKGNQVGKGQPIGSIVCLSERSLVASPIGGTIASVQAKAGPVSYGQVLVEVKKAEAVAEDGERTENLKASLAFTAPTSGRFYSKPAPDKPAFAAVGSVVKKGDVICMVEVMKTFNRIQYGGDDLPESARVEKVLVSDGADIEHGDPLVEISAVK